MESPRAADRLGRRVDDLLVGRRREQQLALYIVSALILGASFATYSGTVESIVYDTVVEETGSSDAYPARIGRVRLVESLALVASSLTGGALAGLTDPRLTYFASVPFAALAVIAYLGFDEPQLHKTGDRIPLRDHIAVRLVSGRFTAARHLPADHVDTDLENVQHPALNAHDEEKPK